MDILFIHGNYPAQFKYLCAGFGANKTHRTVFLTASQDALKNSIPGVETIVFEQHRQVSSEGHHYLHATEQAVLQGQAILRSVNSLMVEGFRPNLIIYHGGMGLGLFLRDILPDCILIGYFEWWFSPATTKHLVKDFDLDMQLVGGLRNLPTLQEIERCDAAVVPTHWQKQQFPELVKYKLNVIFDGVDTNFFHPNNENINNKVLTIKNRDTCEQFTLEANKPMLTYATRGMEPLRGFPEFMRSLPEAFRDIKDLQVVIAGADRCAYSYPAPSHNGSWKHYMMDEIKEKIQVDRVHFCGLLSYTDYRLLLWRSNLHCYFTRPYVTSWSLFEAASCGTRLLSNHGPATSDIIEENTASWINLDDQQEINRAIVQELKNYKSPLKKKAKIQQGYDLASSLAQWEALINKCIADR